MTTLQVRPPYTPDELDKLYPKGLQLQLVQVLLRHGERTPVSARFETAGLAPYWPYCAAAKRFASITMTDPNGATWDNMEWRRRLETFGVDDGPVIALGPNAQIDSICNLGELTDQGRRTTMNLGQRLRNLYVDQLGFMPKLISDADMIYLRATPVPRALESLQQAFWGMYPASTRAANFPAPTIITRTPADETLYPNDGGCRRFSQLSRAFAQRTAERWNHTQEMDYVNNLISKWMPEGSKRVAVDGHPRISGIMDTINSTLAHGPSTRLPKEFYDSKGRDIIDRIGVEEWFSGYSESQEYRALGIGALLGDIVSRMVGNVEKSGNDGILEVAGDDEKPGIGRGGERSIRFAMSGCHDTTLAALLASLGAFDEEKWPPYTSHIALELFKRSDQSRTVPHASERSIASTGLQSSQKGFWGSLVSRFFKQSSPDPITSNWIARRGMDQLTVEEKERLQDYYVRIRYNDRPVVVEGCKATGNHLDGDQTFCTLSAFKEVVDKFTPKNWKQDCASNLDKSPFPSKIEPPG